MPIGLLDEYRLTSKGEVLASGRVHAIKAPDLEALSVGDLAAIATQMLTLIRKQRKHISDRSEHISHQRKHICEQDKRIDSQAQAIKWRDAKIESITFQLARLKAWKFGAKNEAMNAEQRGLIEETLAADQAQPLRGPHPLRPARADQRARRCSHAALDVGHLERADWVPVDAPVRGATRAFELGSRIVHAAETLIALLDPGGGKTKKAYMWDYASGAFEPEPGVD